MNNIHIDAQNASLFGNSGLREIIESKNALLTPILEALEAGAFPDEWEKSIYGLELGSFGYAPCMDWNTARALRVKDAEVFRSERKNGTGLLWIRGTAWTAPGIPRGRIGVEFSSAVNQEICTSEYIERCQHTGINAADRKVEMLEIAARIAFARGQRKAARRLLHSVADVMGTPEYLRSEGHQKTDAL